MEKRLIMLMHIKTSLNPYIESTLGCKLQLYVINNIFHCQVYEYRMEIDNQNKFLIGRRILFIHNTLM